MSTVSDPPDFVLWDVVCCSKCLLPFLSSAGPTIPFWLTECGHILCNNHLSPDQSCTQCGAQGVQLVPLQKEMEAPMSDWFRPVPSALDEIAYSVKFQQAMMTTQIVSLRSRCQQQRMVIDRLKSENSELKKINEELSRTSQGHPRFNIAKDNNDRGPSDTVNTNGKRPWNDPHQFDEGTSIPRTAASPRCMLDSERFTFSPQRTSKNAFSANSGHGQDHAANDPYDPPPETITQLSKQYAYGGPSSLQYKPPPLSRSQAAPPAYQRRTQYTYNSGHFKPLSARNVQSNFPATPRPQSRFKPAKILYTTANENADLANPSNLQRATDQELKKLGTMGPPPPHRQRQETRPYQVGVNGVSKNNVPPVTTNRFLSTCNGQAPSIPTSSSRRFLPPAPHIGGAPHVLNESTNANNNSSRMGNGRQNVR